MININILKQSSIFVRLDNNQLEKIARILHKKKFKVNEFIIKENSIGNSLYILTKGKVSISKKLTMLPDEDSFENKKFITLNSINNPIFGEVGLVSGTRTANVIAETDCEVYELTRKSFQKIAQMDFQIGYFVIENIAKNIAKKLEKTDNEVVKLSTALTLAFE